MIVYIFLVYISDPAKNFKGILDIKLFADDSKLQKDNSKMKSAISY